VRGVFDEVLIEAGLDPEVDSRSTEAIDLALRSGERRRRARTRLRCEWWRARDNVAARVIRVYHRLRPSRRPSPAPSELAEDAD
jgi:hypothetical protein